jgi:hypothetical protein
MKNYTFAGLFLLLAMTACAQKPVLEQIDVHKAVACTHDHLVCQLALHALCTCSHEVFAEELK